MLDPEGRVREAAVRAAYPVIRADVIAEVELRLGSCLDVLVPELGETLRAFFEREFAPPAQAPPRPGGQAGFAADPDRTWGDPV